ncbi:hypothetical protein BCR33DRAFT_721812 [Rhizoclosmatium globosum]|uniref:Uncharacterized protein n=1 Tax=Rhizoclosmatium globosum TaxID=329046 RepID=A0A1Y2BQ68_9FUNG|nr:hypothetical protein BCR33DRAFT_721812 [Rhizoclosmatium globosum]|eukprot:ORY36893.1 hypothetical protein BCR33DRAFT_721812 [Rhizoclosmatium globosum]
MQITSSIEASVSSITLSESIAASAIALTCSVALVAAFYIVSSIRTRIHSKNTQIHDIEALQPVKELSTATESVVAVAIYHGALQRPEPAVRGIKPQASFDSACTLVVDQNAECIVPSDKKLGGGGDGEPLGFPAKATITYASTEETVVTDCEEEVAPVEVLTFQERARRRAAEKRRSKCCQECRMTPEPVGLGITF